jgi:hypothetical protein
MCVWALCRAQTYVALVAKQIGAIVKTIQTDTQDAVAAMEKSTQGVVEGAKLSDNAGQALAEIGEVSGKLAQLIQTISQTTQAQAKSAGAVAMSMRNILGITEQATEGTFTLQKGAAIFDAGRELTALSCRDGAFTDFNLQVVATLRANDTCTEGSGFSISNHQACAQGLRESSR